MSRWDKFQDTPDLPIQAFSESKYTRTYEGGGGGTTTSTGTTYTSPLPEYAEPYFKDVMGRAQKASLTPYQQYGGERVADLTPAQQLAAQQVYDMSAAGTPEAMQLGQAGTALTAGRTAGFEYDPSAIGANMLSAADLGQVQQFMSPYMQAVVDQEKQAALRDYQIADQMRTAKAVGAGAFGGSREAVTSAESQRALMSQLQGIQSSGMQTAYDRAIDALTGERAAGLEAEKATEASRQFGADSWLRAMGLTGDLSGQLGQMGETEQRMAMERAQALQGVGREQRDVEQQRLDQSYADYAAQRDYEQNMINWYTGILYGAPTGVESTVYNTAPSAGLASQIGGLGIAALGLGGAGK